MESANSGTPIPRFAKDFIIGCSEFMAHILIPLKFNFQSFFNSILLFLTELVSQTLFLSQNLI